MSRSPPRRPRRNDDRRSHHGHNNNAAATSAPVSGGTTGAIDKAFFDDAAFIGDIRTQGLMMYTGLDNATFYATQGLMVDTYFTKEFVKQGDKKVTIPEALKSQQFGKIYVSLGINELGWAYSSVFIKKYGEVVDNLKSLQPGAAIYVEAILPVTKKKSDGDKIYNNAKIDEYNASSNKWRRKKGCASSIPTKPWAPITAPCPPKRPPTACISPPPTAKSGWPISRRILKASGAGFRSPGNGISLLLIKLSSIR